MKTLKLEEIQKEIHDNYLDLKSGIYDVYDFCAHIGNKYHSAVDPEYGERYDRDPYTDLTFALLEVNGIELY